MFPISATVAFLDEILAQRTYVLSLLCHKADFHRRYAMGPYSIFTQLCVFVYFFTYFLGYGRCTDMFMTSQDL